MKSRVRRLAAVPQFQGYTEVRAITDAAALSETRRITMDAKWQAKNVG
jgi:hypothetical protein